MRINANLETTDTHGKDVHKVLSKRRLSVLNIPSGSGRLNDLLDQYYGQITCVDICSQALISVKRKQNGAQIKLEKNFIQNYNFRTKYDAVFCNYGISYMNGMQLQKFLKKVKDGIKKNGLLIVKEVYLADE
jgi:2-polyprenyl-3-methyl-5-hydroxy-6-metoxy-1,4-benzoquinol methylase